jgi:hypothetical protein
MVNSTPRLLGTDWVGPTAVLVVWRKSVGTATVSVTWLITLKGEGQNRPWVSGTLIYEGVSS